MELTKVARERFGKFFFRFPEGESAADVYDRVTGMHVLAGSGGGFHGQVLSFTHEPSIVTATHFGSALQRCDCAALPLPGLDASTVLPVSSFNCVNPMISCSTPCACLRLCTVNQ